MLEAIANIAGAFLDSKSNKDSNKANAKINAENNALQEKFAQEGIRWKVADAKKAGIHPLYALGAQTTSFQPSSIGHQPNSISENLSRAGQSLDRAIATKGTRLERLNERLLETQIRGQEIDNDKKASDLARTSGAQVSPPFPTSVHKGVDAGVPNSSQLFMNPDGTKTLWPSVDAKQAIEDSLYEYEHMFHNRLIPFATGQSDIHGNPAKGWRGWLRPYVGLKRYTNKWYDPQ